MTEPIIICPSCSAEIKLTESLAAPLVLAVRQECEQKIAQKERDVSARHMRGLLKTRYSSAQMSIEAKALFEDLRDVESIRLRSPDSSSARRSK
jgi:hypothetical protein